MMDSAFTLTPDTNKTDLTTTTGTVNATIVTRKNIGGTAGTITIIGTITIEIDASWFSLGKLTSPVMAER
jgi:hypothetical protein